MKPNPEKVVKFTALDNEYTLFFGMRALRGFELETGQAINNVFSGDTSIDLIAKVIRHGLSQAHPGIDDESVNDIVDDFGFEEILELALEALYKAYPKTMGNGKTPNPNQTETVEVP